MDVVAESVVEVYAKREHIVGLQFTYEPEDLRFFLARFAPAVVA
jgi:tyrosine phenol-lyase